MGSTSSSSTSFSPVGLGISAGFDLLGLGMHLLAAHDERIQLARKENAASDQAIQAFDSDMHTIFAAANAGIITEAVAVHACNMVETWYWQWITPFSQHGSVSVGQCNIYQLPDGSWTQPANSNPKGCGSNQGGKLCTAGCCFGCALISIGCRNAANVFSKGGGSWSTWTVTTNKYSSFSRQGYSLSYKRPAHVNQEAEVTLNVRSGLVTVGAPPSNQDVVVASGVISATAVPDSGGIVSGISATSLGAPFGINSTIFYLGLGFLALLAFLGLSRR